MPFVSKAQQRAMHAKASRGEISPAVVHEFDEATKKAGGFAKLPEKKSPEQMKEKRARTKNRQR